MLSNRNGSVVATLLVMAFLLPSAASAGWVIEMQNVFVRKSGSMPPEPMTMKVEDNRARIEQSDRVTLIDYRKQHLSLLNTNKQYFWSGSVKDYISEKLQKRAAKRGRRRRKTPVPPKAAKIDETKLPKIVIRPTEEKKEIAGYTAQRYLIESNGVLFQEVWVADGLTLGDDLDPVRVLEYDRKMADIMRGQVSATHQALARSPEYLALLKRGMVLRSILYHGGGDFEQAVLSLRKEDVDVADFKVPENFRRVRLAELFPAERQSNAVGR